MSLPHLLVSLREKSCAAVFYNQRLCLRSALLLKELGHMVAVTARRAMGHLCRVPAGPVVTESIQTTVLGCLTKEPCSKLWRERVATEGGNPHVLSQALQMRGELCLTLKGLRNCRGQEGQSPGPACTSRYSGGGRRLSSFLSSSPFQYLKLSSRCCIRSGRSTKAGETDRDAVSAVSARPSL